MKKCLDRENWQRYEEIHALSHSYSIQRKQGISRKGVVQMLKQMLNKYEARQSSFGKQLL